MGSVVLWVGWAGWIAYQSVQMSMRFDQEQYFLWLTIGVGISVVQIMYRLHKLEQRAAQLESEQS